MEISELIKYQYILVIMLIIYININSFTRKFFKQIKITFEEIICLYQRGT